MFAKTSHYLKRIWLTKLNFASITKSQVVVFDQEGIDVLLPSIGKTKFFVVSVRYEEIYANYKVVFVTLFNLIKCKNLPLAYVCALIKLANPTLVLTLVDNNLLFHKASGHLRKIRFIAFQNGSRFPENSVYRFPPHHKLNSELFCMGQNDIDGYEIEQISFRRISAAGTIRNSLHVANTRAESDSLEPPYFDLCLISMFNVHTPTAPRGESYLQLVKYVAKFVQDNPKIKIAIASRYRQDLNPSEFQIEEKYYQEIFSGENHLICVNGDRYSTYRIVDASKVNISFGSTASFEAMARGHRTIVCQPLLEEDMQLEKGKDWYLSGVTYHEFSDQLRKFLSMSDNDYSLRYQSDIEYYAGPRNIKPTYEILSDIIKESKKELV